MSKFVQWWQQNPDRAELVRAKRRKRLQDDPDAAEAHRQRCRDYYRRKKSERTTARESRGANRPKVIWIDGVAVEHWGSGQTASYLGIAVVTLRSWEASGVFPEGYKDAASRRWWPVTFVKRVKPIVELHRQIHSLPHLRTWVLKEWEHHKTEVQHEDDGPPDDNQGLPLDQATGDAGTG